MDMWWRFFMQFTCLLDLGLGKPARKYEAPQHRESCFGGTGRIRRQCLTSLWVGCCGHALLDTISMELVMQ